MGMPEGGKQYREEHYTYLNQLLLAYFFSTELVFQISMFFCFHTM